MTASKESEPAAWYDVGEPEDFPDGAVWPVQADGVAVAVFRLGDALHALHDLCTHGAAKLSDGYVEDGCIECPLHQGTFEIATGAPCRAPVTEAVRSFPVRVVAGRVEVAVPPAVPISVPPA
jgi:nitrite reductase/ring-hydroxylating ferredoxin subunit